MNVSFESTKEGLMVSVGLAGTDKHGKGLLEYEGVQALRSVPGKGLVCFASRPSDGRREPSGTLVTAGAQAAHKVSWGRSRPEP